MSNTTNGAINTTTLAAIPLDTPRGSRTLLLPAGSPVTAWNDSATHVAVRAVVSGETGAQTIARDRAAKYLAAVPAMAAVSAPAVERLVAPVAQPSRITVSSMVATGDRKEDRAAVSRNSKAETSQGRAGSDNPLTTLNFSSRDAIINTESKLRGVADVAGVLVTAGLDWTVSKHKTFMRDPATGAEVEVPRAAILRDDTQRILGTVGPRYEPVQNAAAFALLDVLREQGAEFVGAGSFSEGGTVFVQMDLKADRDIVPGDTVKSYMLVRNSHDGTGSYLVRTTPVRAVCYNTLTHASFERDAATKIFGKLKHTKNVHASIGDVKEVLRGLRRQAEVAFDTYAQLAKVSVTPAMLSAVFADIGIFQLPDDAEQERARENAMIRRSAVQELFEGKGAGSKLPGVSGTAWGLYNALTEFGDWQFAQGSRTDDAKNESRLVGRAADMKESALEIIASVAGLKM